MNMGLVELEKLRKNFDKADFKQGKSSYCFIIGDKIVKVYAEKYGDNYIPNKVCDLSMFDADTIVFPDEYIYENGKIVGEIARYIQSEEITRSFDDNAKVDKIIQSYEAVIGDLYLYKDINMVDLCYVNILFSNKLGFHIIDTTEWQFQNDSLKKNIYYFNMSLINALVEYLEIPVNHSKYHSKIDDIYLNNIKKYGDAGADFKRNIELLMNNKYSFLRFLISYMNMYKIYYGTDAKSLNDINKFTKVLKKVLHRV